MTDPLVCDHSAGWTTGEERGGYLWARCVACGITFHLPREWIELLAPDEDELPTQLPGPGRLIEGEAVEEN